MHLWVGRAQVKARAGSTVADGMTAASVVAVVYARDYDDVASEVIEFAYEQSLDTLSVGDIELYQDRLQRGEVDDAMREIAESLTEENPVGFCAFEPIE